MLKKNIKIVFISTAEVFDGYKGNYHEKSLPNPLCYYGVTKYKVEKFLKDLKIVYTILKKLKKGDKQGEVIISGKRNLIKL